MWLFSGFLLVLRLASEGGVAAQVYKCHPMCKRCHLFDYNLEWHCVECEAGYTLWVDGCFEPCPSGQYRYGYNCVNCTVNCEECYGSLRHECLRCMPDYQLDFRGVCVKVCANGSYPLPSGEDCAPCNSYCKRCVQGYPTSCTACHDGSTLRVLEPNTQSGECNLNCPVGFFRDSPDDPRCVQCAEFCDVCESADNCFECKPGCTLYRGICYSTQNAAVQEGINYEQYLQSGAGIDWDPSVAPDWDAFVVPSSPAPSR